MQRKARRVPSSGHLSRLKPVEIDPLAEYGLPSKGEKRLLVAKTQEAYYAKIAERYLAFCTSAGDRDELQKQFARLAISPSSAASSSTTTTPGPSAAASSEKRQSDLSQILSALRKLREGILASKRRDAFATQVYLFAIRLGVLVSSYETYQPALLYLLGVIHPAYNLTSLELQEAISYLVLDAACRRGDLAEAFALRNKHRLRDAKVDGVLRALARDDWVLWRKMKRSVDGHRAKLMDFAEPQLQAHTLKAFGRSYLSVSLDYLEAATGASWSALRAQHGVGWELNGGRVVIRKIQGRS